MGIFDWFKVKGLIRKLKDKDSDVREKAAEALGKIGNPAVEPLIWALKDKDSGVRREAAEALGKIKDARAVEPLIWALKDKDDIVRMVAARALGKIKDARAVEPLIRALKDKNRFVQCKAAEALEEMGWVPKDDTENVYYLIVKREWDKITKIGKPAVEPLIQVLKDRDNYIRENLYIDEDIDIGKEVAEALVKIGKPAVEPLIRALKDEDSYVRLKAAEILGKIKMQEQ